jgi:carbonic anhydrase/acetyltransferase-like protein (isoleucine patch superfamily)
MMGVPARPRRPLTDEDLALIHRPANNYVRLAAQYREDG